MKTDSENLYEPPAANLSKPTFGLDDLPRLSAWWVFLFTIVTIFLFALYWLFHRSMILNRIFPDKPIPAVFTIGAPTVWLGSFAVEMLDIGFALNLGSETWGDPMSFISTVYVTLWAFSIRKRLNWLFGNEQADLRVHGAFTFLFSPYYLAYKINQAKDAAVLESNIESASAANSPTAL